MATSSTNVNGVEIHHIEFRNWESLIPFLDEASGWVFRGQEKHPGFPLQTSLERASSFLLEDGLSLERRVLREFKRRAKLSGEPNLPCDSDVVEWLALLQHHGAPTRLLDFTHSVYVALFFAVERAQMDAEIWCVRASALSRQLAEPWSGNKNTALSLLLEPEADPSQPNPPSAVFKDEPFYLNRRLALQQGCFLIPFDVSKSFWENLVSPQTGLSDGHNTNLPDFTWYLKQLNFFRILIRKPQHSAIRRQLRQMNITREQLFPGIDGMAESFWQEP